MDLSLNQDQELIKNSVEKFISESYDYETRRIIISSNKGYNEENIVCKMIISGINRQIDIPLTLLEISKEQYKASSSFIISLKDFNIEIPKLLFIPIDDEININIEFLIAGGNNK